MDSIYANSMEQKVSLRQKDLDDLANILTARQFTRHEYNSAERSLQILVEACIGLSKHLVKVHNHTVPADAYQSIERLKSLGYFDQEDDTNWRKIIGLRNALVHDYLSIEPEIVKTIISKKYYETLINFSRTAIAKLRTS